MFRYAVLIRYLVNFPASVCYTVFAKNGYDAIHLVLADLKSEKVTSVEVHRIHKEISSVETEE